VVIERPNIAGGCGDRPGEAAFLMAKTKEMRGGPRAEKEVNASVRSK
jgi:hypothetical protein